MILRARIVFPVGRPAIENGAVVVSGSEIRALGSWNEMAAEAAEAPTDLGEVILLPGLVNAHCHLDYTSMTGLPEPQHFSDWIKSLLARKAEASYTDYADAWLAGARMLQRTGCTTVADIEAVPELLPDVWSSTPLRVCSFLEMTGVRSRRPPLEIVREAAAKIESLKPVRGLAGLSPHALYSTSPALLRESAKVAREHGWRVTTHVAESDEEFDMYMHGRGRLFDWLKGQRDMSDCGQGTPVAQLEQCGILGENFLAVHGNYLLPADIAALSRSGASVVHCPRSHAYFQHQRFAFEDLAGAGINVCLGTDSLASVSTRRGKPELNLFAEMRQFASVNPGVLPGTIVEMATRNGARALGWQGRVGELSPGTRADLIAVPFTGHLADAAAAIAHHRGDVSFSMIDGDQVVAPVTTPATR